MLHRIFRTQIFTGKPSEVFQGLTIKWHITNLCSKWFHLVFLNTERCPKSCCNQEAWTWMRKRKLWRGGKQELRPGWCHTHPLLWNTKIQFSDIAVTSRKGLWKPDSLKASPRIYLERIPNYVHCGLPTCRISSWYPDSGSIFMTKWKLWQVRKQRTRNSSCVCVGWCKSMLWNSLLTWEMVSSSREKTKGSKDVPK